MQVDTAEAQRKNLQAEHDRERAAMVQQHAHDTKELHTKHAEELVALRAEVSKAYADVC